ncbi:CHAT domain-containing protein [Sorangium sp. So ce136]|uniref:CHAT domain-containing protein n=1 Tax=Sorangium sp. So ce136 TaxID=3133284 RepID=UPI003F000404
MTRRRALRTALEAAILGAMALALAGDAHRPPTPATPASTAPAPPLEVEFAGCSAVHAGPACALPDDRTLRLWVKAPMDARVVIAVDATVTADAPLAALDGALIQEGVLARVPVPDGADALSVTAERDGARASFRLPLLPPLEAPPLKDAEALRRNGKLDEASSALDALASAPDPAVQALAIGKRARVDLARGRIPEAIAGFEASIRAHRAAGRVSDEFLDRLALSYTLLYNGRRFAEARAALGALGPLEAIHPEGRALKPYYEALLSSESGDLRAALRQLDASAAGAERLGLGDHRLHVLQMRADLLQTLGRPLEAQALLREVKALLPASSAPCEQASLLNDIGWNALHVAWASDGSSGPLADAEAPLARADAGSSGPLADAEAPLTAALALYRGPCPRPAEQANALTNLALAKLEAGQTGAARALLDEARRTDPRPDARVAMYWIEIEGRIALRSGNPASALRIYDRLSQLAEASELPEGRYRAALGRGRALEALGRLDAAIAAYEGAEAVRSDLSLLVPLGQGRGGYLGRFEESARLEVDLLLRRDPRRALRAARRSRALALAALRWIDGIEALGGEERARWETALAAYRDARAAFDEEGRDDWRLSSDELEAARVTRASRGRSIRALLDEALFLARRGEPAPAELADAPALAEGELMLVLHPIRDGWAGFAVSRGGVVARRLPALDLSSPAAELAAGLLAPFAAPLRAATRLRVAAHGALDRIDFHALPWEGAPLVARMPVTYGLDLPERGARPADVASATRSAGAAGETRPADAASAPRSAGAAGETRPADAASAPRSALVVADPRRDLPAARREADAVARALEGKGLRVERLSGGLATHRAVAGALEQPGIEVFHYAGHGFFGGLDGWDSGLALAGGSELAVGDILALRRAPARVVLSGCDTARTEAAQAAPGARGLGLGLAQALLVAGARSVIAATRPVDDALAERVMAALYAGEQQDPAAQLREATLAALRADPSCDWASFRALVP